MFAAANFLAHSTAVEIHLPWSITLSLRRSAASSHEHSLRHHHQIAVLSSITVGDVCHCRENLQELSIDCAEAHGFAAS